jgi:hypothetical protein
MTPDPDAPAVIHVDGRGTVTVEIADHEGRVLPYLIARDRTALAPVWAVLLWHVGEALAYRVDKVPGQPWRCDCPDSKYRASRLQRTCKHVVCCRKIKAVIDLLTTAPEPTQCQPIRTAPERSSA